jgi:hypothetical protein
VAESIQCPLRPSLVRWPNAGLRPPGIAANASSQRNPGLEGFGGDRERLMSALVWIDLSKRSRGLLSSPRKRGGCPGPPCPRAECVQTSTDQSERLFFGPLGQGRPAQSPSAPRERLVGHSRYFGAPLKCVPLLLSRLLLSREPQSQSDPIDVSDRPAPHYPHDVLEAAIHKPCGKRGFRGSSRHGQREAICSAVLTSAMISQ